MNRQPENITKCLWNCSNLIIGSPGTQEESEEPKRRNLLLGWPNLGRNHFSLLGYGMEFSGRKSGGGGGGG